MRGQVSTVGEPACCVDQSENQYKNSSLKSTWDIHEGDLLTMRLLPGQGLAGGFLG